MTISLSVTYFYTPLESFGFSPHFGTGHILLLCAVSLPSNDLLSRWATVRKVFAGSKAAYSVMGFGEDELSGHWTCHDVLFIHTVLGRLFCHPDVFFGFVFFMFAQQYMHPQLEGQVDPVSAFTFSHMTWFGYQERLSRGKDAPTSCVQVPELPLGKG